MRKLLSMILTAVLLAATLVPAALAEGQTFEDSVDWAAEYDVIVVGFGVAGGSTAITAADNGAKVLLLEKAPEAHAGGNSAVCKQWICYVRDHDQAVEYMKSMRGNFLTPTDDFIEGYITEIAKNMDWCISLGAPEPTDRDYVEYPDNAGAGMIDLFTVGTTQDDGSAYRLIKTNVQKRADAIDVWYEAPGVSLIQDPATGIIHGVVAEVNGETVNLRAKNGVVLCTGGFESNRQMQEDYLVRNNLHSLGNIRYNTGDGIRMAQEVGANLWHMGNIAGPWLSFMDKETETVYFNMTPPAYAGIFVGPDGTRFVNERASNKHGKVYFHGTYLMFPVPETMYAIFDETIMNAGPLINAFTQDNQAELEKGWIVRADTLEELAQKTGISADGLTAEIAKYNAYCDAGSDSSFARDPQTLQKIETGPYYALELTAAVINTQGGPERNLNGEVLDTHGTPIPHLYEAGELRDVWSNGYQASCNIGGGMAFGRISGANAAAEKTDNFRGSVMEGKTAFSPAANATADYACAENEFIGSAMGKGGTPLVVKVTMDADTIVAIEVLEHSETEGISDRAFSEVIAEILSSQSTEVDAVTNATITSDAIMAAVADALAKR